MTDHDLDVRLIPPYEARRLARQAFADAEDKLTGLVKINAPREALIAAIQACNDARTTEMQADHAFGQAALDMRDADERTASAA